MRSFHGDLLSLLEGKSLYKPGGTSQQLQILKETVADAPDLKT